MKTKSKIKNVKEMVVLAVVCASVLFMASCKKEEIAPTPMQNKASDPLKKILPRVFTVLKINHFAMRTVSPDYSVEMTNEGLVTYTGRDNVAVKGEVHSNVSGETVSQIFNLYASVNFDKYKKDPASYIMGSLVFTQFDDGIHGVKSAMDFSNGYPAELVSLRTKAEKLLKIGQYVTNPIKTVDTTVHAEASAK
ncbi:MAG: DUF6438 domain-containing protein [Bacteroidia bacterium]